MSRYFKPATAILTVFFFSLSAFADTVVFKDGERAKGLILGELKDRIILSTVDGEKEIMKSSVKYAIYDSEEKTLLQAGRNEFRNRQYIKAYYMYAKAAELNPDSKDARERLTHLTNYLERKDRQDILREIGREKISSGPGMPTAEEKLLTELGLELLQGEKHVSVKRIVKRKQKTDGQRLAPGDKIVAVWGQMTAYMDTGEVSELLLASGEVKITVEKTFEPVLASSKASFFGLIPPNYKKIIGAVLKLRREGVVLLKTFTDGPFENCGIMEGDLVERINGRNVRYMPMSQIFEFIRKNQREKVELVVYRDVTVWG